MFCTQLNHVIQAYLRQMTESTFFHNLTPVSDL